MTIKYKGLVWLGVYVENFAEAVEFYKDTLELPLIRQVENYAHFDAGNGALLELFTEGKASTSPKGTDKQSTMTAILVENLPEVKNTLKAKGVQFTDNEGTFENQRWATFVDLEGNRIEIKELNFKS